MNTRVLAGCILTIVVLALCGATRAEWVNVTNNVGGEQWGYAGVCLVVPVPGGDAILAGVSEAGLWRSEDQGKTWRKLGAQDKEPIRNRPHQIVFDPKDPQRFWISGCYGPSPFVTADAGKTFQRLGNLTHMDGIGIDFTDPHRKTLVVGLHEQVRSVHKSIDGGTTWQKIGDSLPADSNHSTDPIVIDSKSFIINTAGWAQGKSWGTYRTEDGGATWIKVAEFGCSGRALLASDGTIYWGLGWSSGLVKSPDKGKSWQKITGPAKFSPIELENGEIAAIGGQQVYVSADGGQKWKKLGDPIPFKPNGIAYNAKSNSLYAWRSTEKKVTDAIVRWEPPAYPIKVSENHRYFVDQKNQPFFWLGTTQWQLFRGYSREDARMIIEKTKEKGFTVAQVMLTGVGDGTAANVYGEKPWVDNNPLTPNEAYLKNVDAVLQMARENDLIISMTVFHQRHRKFVTAANARAWGKWLGQRYKDVPNIVWSSAPATQDEFIPLMRELAAGLREGDGGRHLITFKPDPAPHASGFLHDEPWLDFTAIQTWKWVEQIYPMVNKDYNHKIVKPVVMGEGAYEQGSEYGFEVTPLWIRCQAYYTYLAGGHHSYGHNDSWRILPTWKQALDAPGATQLGILKKAFMDRQEWWCLVPDQSIFATGNTTGQILNLAARHKDGNWVMVYLGSKADFSINMNKLAGASRALWIDPRTGNSKPIGRFANSGVQSFSTPDGWEDALLILEAGE